MPLIDREEARGKFSKVLAYMGSDVDRILYNIKTIDTYTEEDVRNAYNDGYSCGMEQGMAKGKAEPVKHGRWLYDSRSGKYFCSNCDESTDDTCMGKPRAKYCPNCGAKMDLEE